MSGPERPRGKKSGWLLPAVTAVCTVALGLATNVAATLLPDSWTRHHLAWWIGTGVLGIVTVALTVRRARSERPEPAVTIGDTSGTVVIAEQGAHVVIQSSQAAPAPSERAGQIVVGELPGAPPAFVVRDAVTALEAAFKAGDRVAAVSALSGGRGAGKTQVAAEFARRAVADGVPVVAWVSAEDHGRLVSGLAELAHRLGVADPEGDSERSAARTRDALAARTEPAILVLDNATDPQDVRHYLPATGATQVVITSTNHAFAFLGTEIQVDVFARGQSLAYFAKRTGLDDESGADAVAEELGDLPLALAQAATAIKLRGLSYAQYLEQLRSFPLDDMLPLDLGSDYPHAVAGALLLSLQIVEDGDPSGMTTQTLLSVGLLSDEGVSRTVLAHVVGIDGGNAGRQLDETLGRLVETSLLVWAKDRDAVVMHRLVARTIRDRLERGGELSTVVGHVRRHLSRLMVDKQDAWQHREASVEIVGHVASFWDAVTRAADRGKLARRDIEQCAYMAEWAVVHLRATADVSRAIQLGTSVLADCERILGPDAPHTLVSRDNLAGAYRDAGDLTNAIPLLQANRTDAERILGPDHPNTLGFGNNLAGAYQDAGDYTNAIPLLQATLTDAERVLGPDHPNTLVARNNLANAYNKAGDLTNAIPLFEATLTDSERVLGPDHPVTSLVRSNLAAALATGDEVGN